jgi:hypothetical protein
MKGEKLGIPYLSTLGRNILVSMQILHVIDT